MLCFTHGIDYENLPTGRKADYIREIIEYFERQRRVPDLIKWIEKERSFIDWETELGKFSSASARKGSRRSQGQIPLMTSSIRSTFFGEAWLQFGNVADALVILHPEGEGTISSLERELIRACDLVNQAGTFEQSMVDAKRIETEWGSVVKAISEFEHYLVSSQTNRALTRDLRFLVIELVRKVIVELSKHRSLSSVQTKLEAQVVKLEVFWREETTSS